MEGYCQKEYVHNNLNLNVQIFIHIFNPELSYLIPYFEQKISVLIDIFEHTIYITINRISG